jgi:hypothetical protein
LGGARGTVAYAGQTAVDLDLDDLALDDLCLLLDTNTDASTEGLSKGFCFGQREREDLARSDHGERYV